MVSVCSNNKKYIPRRQNAFKQIHSRFVMVTKRAMGIINKSQKYSQRQGFCFHGYTRSITYVVHESREFNFLAQAYRDNIQMKGGLK